MSIRSIIAIGLAAFGLVLGVASDAVPLQSAQAGFVAQTGGSDTIIVKFQSNASEQAIAALNASQAVQHVEAIPALGLRVLRVASGTDAAAVARNYGRNANVEFAEVNALVAPDGTPDDPYFSTQWHLAKIESASAWDRANAAGVIATVCDTGVNGSHPDLASVLLANLGWNAVDGSSNWSPVIGHGTAVSGTLAAATNNAAGVAGVAWGARIIPVRISNLSDGNAYISDAAKCIQYGADKGSKVVNVSYRMAGYAAIDTAGKYAQAKGALTFVAAGNEGIEQNYASYTGFIAVGATDKFDAIKSFSTFGNFVDLSAPGDGIRTTWVDGGYNYASGTSFASPVAAGVAAMIYGARPGISAGQVESILLSSADDLGAAGKDKYFGTGRVNARKAVEAALGLSPSPTPSPTATATNTPTPTPTVAQATPTSTPTVAAPTPMSTSTPLPTATPSPTRTLLTETFKGKLNVKSSPTKSHSVTVRAEGPLDLTLSWTGKGNVTMKVMGASGSLTSQTVGPVALTVPAGTYTVVVTATSGSASYQVKATHY